MRHQAKYVSLAIADAGDIFNGTIRIRFGNNPPVRVGIAQNHLPIGVKLPQRLRVREETAFAMRDWHAEKRAFLAAMCEWRVDHFYAHCHHVADESQGTVSHECPGQKAGFAQYLEPIARTEHQLAVMRVADYRAHYWREASNRAATKIIPISESTRQHDRVKIIKRRFLVPDVFGVQPFETINRRDTILIAI